MVKQIGICCICIQWDRSKFNFALLEPQLHTSLFKPVSARISILWWHLSTLNSAFTQFKLHTLKHVYVEPPWMTGFKIAYINPCLHQTLHYWNCKCVTETCLHWARHYQNPNCVCKTLLHLTLNNKKFA